MITPTTSKSTVTNSSGYPNMTLGTNRDFVAERSATKSRKTPRVYSNKSKSPERTRAPARRTGARRRPQRLYYTDPDLMTTGLHEGIRSHEATHPTNAPSKLGFKISRKQLITGFSVLATVMVFSLCCCTDHGKQAIRRLLARNSENPQLLRSPAFTDVMVYDKKMRCVRLDRRRLQNRRRLPEIKCKGCDLTLKRYLGEDFTCDVCKTECPKYIGKERTRMYWCQSCKLQPTCPSCFEKTRIKEEQQRKEKAEWRKKNPNWRKNARDLERWRRGD